LQTVRAEIAKHPQLVKTVLAGPDEKLDVQMHPDTLKRFLKKLAVASVASAQSSSRGRRQGKE
jgi:hypothetical protein